jgi:hypothetical protein
MEVWQRRDTCICEITKMKRITRRAWIGRWHRWLLKFVGLRKL